MINDSALFACFKLYKNELSSQIINCMSLEFPLVTIFLPHSDQLRALFS